MVDLCLLGRVCGIILYWIGPLIWQVTKLQLNLSMDPKVQQIAVLSDDSLRQESK